MNKNISEIAEEIRRIQIEIAPDFMKNRIITPPSSDAIQQFEEKLDVKLPEEFKTFLLSNNLRFILDAGYSIINFETMKGNWEMMNKLNKEGKFDGRYERLIERGFDNWDSECLQKVYWSDKWIPFAEDSSGNMKCIDLFPGDEGDLGQLLTFDLQEGTGPNMDWDFIDIADIMEENLGYLQKGKYKYSKENGLEIDKYMKI